MSYQNDLMEEVDDDSENKKDASSKITEKKSALNDPKIKVPRKKNVKMDVQKNKDNHSNST